MQLTGCTCCFIASAVVVVVVSLLGFAIDNFLCTYTRRKIAKEYCQCCGYVYILRMRNMRNVITHTQR